MSLKLSIVTPLKKLVTDLQVKSVTLPSYKGELTILDSHEPLISTLETGVMTFVEESSNKERQVVVNWGYFEVKDNVISVLAETAETKEQINFERAKSSLEKSNQVMNESEDLETIQKYQSKIKKAEARLTLK